MHNYIYGAGKIGAKVKQMMQEYGETLDGYIDSYKKGSYMGKKIFDLSEIESDSRVIISVLNTNSIIEIYHKLSDAGISSIYWYYDSFKIKTNKKNCFYSEQCLDMTGWGQLIMPHIELHISDKCNLNCKGCSHFSPLFDEINANFDEKMKDIRYIKGMFDNVFRIDILGGEPLLNPELSQYIISLRGELPDTFIQIYTNGLLIPKLETKVLKTIADYDIGISISEYKPTHAMIGRIRDTLDEYDIRYHIAEYNDKQLFNTPISIKQNSKYPRLCISDGCITISNGKIARCPTLMYIEKFNSYFKQNLPTEGIYAISDYSNGEQLLEDMKKNVPLCNHCIQCEMEWSVCEKQIKLEDFAVDE